jgi:hypothetical protein
LNKLPLLALLPCLLSSDGYAEAVNKHWHDPTYISNSFADIAHNNEYSNNKSPLRKWQQAIRYRIEDNTGDSQLHQQLVSIHLEHLAAITGLNISQSANANFTIIFTSELKLNQILKNVLQINNVKERQMLLKESVCLANIKVAKDHSISRAIVIIPVDRARAHGKLLSCVVEELTQVLGLPNDSDKVYPSIFNDKSTNDALSGLDFILLKLLYNRQLKAGMSIRQTKAIVKKLLTQKMFKQAIEQAEYRMMNEGIAVLLK